MILLLFLIGACYNGVNAQGGYEAYGGGGPVTTVSSSAGYGGEESVQAPLAPIQPPRLNSADADVINQAAESSAAAAAAAAASNSSETADNSAIKTDAKSHDNSKLSYGENSSAVKSEGSDATTADAAVGSEKSISSGQQQQSNVGPSLGYRSPPPPRRREAESEGQCAFDASKWSVEPQSAISQAIMFDRTTGIGCEECLTKCSAEYQDHSSPWVCRSVTYDWNWKICDLFAINGTDRPFFLTEFSGRDYFTYLPALPPTDDQLKAVPKPGGPSGTPRKSSSVSSSSEEKKHKDAHSKTSTKLEINTSDSSSAPSPAAIKTASPQTLPEAADSSKVSESASSEVTGAPSVTVSEAASSFETTQTSAAPVVSENVSQKEETNVLAQQNVAAAENNSASENVAAEYKITDNNSVAPVAVPAAAESAADSSYSNSNTEAAKSFGAKTHQSTQELSSVKQQESDAQQQESSVQQESQLFTVEHPTALITDSPSDNSFVQDTKNSNSSPQTNENESSRFSEFAEALENLKAESNSNSNLNLNSKGESEVSGNTESEKEENLNKPKMIKIGKKTVITTVVHPDSQSVPPAHQFSSSVKQLSSSIHPLPHSTTATEFQHTRKTIDGEKSSTFVKEESSFSESSALASASASSTSKSSFSSSSSSASLPVVISETTKLNTETSQQQKQQDDEQPQRQSTSCEGDEMSRFVAFEGFERQKSIDAPKHFATAKSVEECVEACDSQRLLLCVSVVYSAVRGCELFTSAVDHKDANALQSTSNSSYVEKFCIPTTKAQGIRKISPAVPSHILVGHVQEVTDAKSLRKCLLSCLNAQLEFGFACQSAMWYPLDDDQNCLLNAESRHSQPDVFVPEDPGVVMLYFEQISEKPTASALKIKAIQQMMRFRDIPLQIDRRLKSMKKSDSSKWTRWSSCKESTATTGHSEAKMRVRYLKCAEHKDIRKCPKESLLCGNAQSLHIKRISKINLKTSHGEVPCYAVRDALGRKHCPYGMRTRENGMREFCTSPIDC